MKKLILITLVLLFGFFAGVTLASEVTLIGPNTYTRTTGAPNISNESFTAIVGNGMLVIKNGEANGKNRVSSAVVFVNGKKVLSQNSFNQKIYDIQLPVELNYTNSLSVDLRSAPGSYLTIEVKQDEFYEPPPQCGSCNSILNLDNLTFGNDTINFEQYPDGILGPTCGDSGGICGPLSNEYSSIGVTFVSGTLFQGELFPGSDSSNRYLSSSPPVVKFSKPVYNISIDSYSVWSATLYALDESNKVIETDTLKNPTCGSEPFFFGKLSVSVTDQPISKIVVLPDGCDINSVINALAIAQQPMSGPPGTTFVEWGTGFTPNSNATLHFKRPDGTEYPTLLQPIDAIGHFEIPYTAPRDKPSGTYTWWAIDGLTGAKSNEVSYVITPLSADLNVQTINPQSDELIYQNFFPSPHADQLISGGTISSVIAADGESRLLLRIVANNPGQVTISESQGNIQQNGSVSSLDNYRYASPASSVSVQLQQYGSQYIGFAVYRAPKDFSIPGYENRLTRPITLNVTSTGGNSNVSLTLRRTPIIISHGLWSGPNEPDNQIHIFRDALWNRFEDRGGKDVLDYVLLNDCKSQNADSVILGSSKTRSNIREFLNSIRTKGVTVTQVDYLGHSMGGQWGRLVEQRYGKDTFTYDSGYLHKLITLDTPHIGSFFADIGQFILDNAAGIEIFPFPNAGDYLCSVSIDNKTPVCFGAIKDLTSYGSIENLKEVSVPSHAIMGNKPIDTACVLLSASTWVTGGVAEPIVKLLKVAEMILKIINPAYGCENWFNKFDFSTNTDFVVDLHSQEGGLSGSQLSPFEHKHTASFDSDVNQRFFDLLNKEINDNAFATGFPASSTLLDMQQLLSLKAAPKRLSSSENQTPLGDIQFSKPVTGTSVQPGAQVNVELTLTGNLTLKNVLIMAVGSDAVELVNPPYTAVVTVPADAYDTFVISALGEGTDGNLYSASVTLSVVSSAVLQKVEVTPQSLYLNLGQELGLSVTGTYSDGSIRSLSSSTQGTTYKSSNESILSVSANGTVTPHAIGVGYVLVSPASAEPVTVRVEITASYMDSDFSADHLSGNPPLTVQFKDLSAGYFTNWSWDFGDNQTSTEQNPTHTYLSEGVYTVTLTISGTGGENTESKPNFITIGVGSVIINPQPDAMNTAAPWILTDPNNHSQSGIGDQTLSNSLIGDYMIIWGDVSGWIKPSPTTETKALTSGGTITFSGTYVQLPVIQVTQSILNFGYVPPGSSKDLILEVKNIGGGTLTGTVSACPPFSIISGGNYSLGAGQSQQVIVRYTAPLQEVSQTCSFVFSGGGGLTVQVKGTNQKVGLPWLLLLLGN